MIQAVPLVRRVLGGCAVVVVVGVSLGAAAAQPEPPPVASAPAAASAPPAASAPAASPAAAGEPATPPAAAAEPPPLWRAPTFQRRERGSLVFDNIPPPDAALHARLARYLESREASLLDWLPDGSLLITTRFGDTEQVHRVAGPMRAREQLTFYAEPVRAARASPEGGGFVFLKDTGGNENAQLFYQAADGTVRELTHGDFTHGRPVWAHDGKRLAFYGNDRDGVGNDVYITDVTNGAAPALVVGGKQDTWYPLDWSTDDSKLLVMRYVSISEGYLYIANVASGALTPLDTGARKFGVRDARFAPDGRGIYVLSDEDGELVQLKLIEPVTHQSRRISADSGFEVEAFDVSPDGRFIAYVENQDGRSVLKVLDSQSHADLAPAGLPEGVIDRLAFDRGGQRLAVAVESPRSPRDVYCFDLRTSQVERWTRSEAGAVNASAFAAPELVHYPTWDRVAGHQRLLSAYVYRPRSGPPSPVVIDIHGGPESQFRPRWDPFIQFLVNELGYAVVAPNVRGSSGYGKSFLALDNGELREDAVRDIGSLLVWIGVQPAFDRTRVAVMGGSYGGFMALAALTQYGERLRGGIDVVGISNFVTFLKNTAPYRRDLRRAEYGDEREPHMRDYLERISPLTNASRIKKPLLVVAGQNDPRVPVSESEQLVWRVRSAGGEVWYLVAKDEGHGFARKVNRDAYLETSAVFLQRLAGSGARADGVAAH